MTLTKEEIIARKNKTKVFDISTFEDQKEHYNKYDLHNSKIKNGKFFLYELILDNKCLTYPKLGLFIDTYMVDMALEVEWIDIRRSWEYNIEYDYEYNGKVYQNFVAEDKSELKTSILWHDQMFVYNIWDTRPDWKQLRQAYEKTLWFRKSKQEIRNSQINRIING